MQPAQPFRSLRRLGCGCLVMVILLMVLLSCAVGFGLSHLWATQASAAGSAVVRLSDVVVERASGGDGEGEFVVSEVTFEYSGGEVWLSGTPDGKGELRTDDKAVLMVGHSDGSEGHWEHKFASADGETVQAHPAVDVSGLFKVGANEVTLRLSDLRPAALSSTAYYLVAHANEENVRATRVKYEPRESTTATVIQPTATPTLAPSPNPTASPTAVPKKTVVASPTMLLPTAVPNPTAVASPIATVSPTVVVSPTVTVKAVGAGTASGSDSNGLLLPAGSVALLLLFGGLVWRRRNGACPVVLTGWLEGYDHQTGEVLPLVSLSGYGREAVILREPLRLVRGGELVDEDEDKVVARLSVGDSGIALMTYGEGDTVELGMAPTGHDKTRIEVGSLVLEYRNPLAMAR